MALHQFYTTQNEIPEPLREFYVEKENRWMLDTEPSLQDIANVQQALVSERGLRRETEKQLVEFKTKYEGIDADEHRKLQERVKGLDDADVYDKQGIEVLVSRRTESMKADHERQVQAKDREITQLRTQAGESDRRWRQDRIKTALLEAVNKHGVYDKAVDDAVQRGLAVFTDLDEQGQVIAKKGEDVVYGKDGINPLRPEEWISTLKTSGQAPHLWPPSSGGGAPPQHGGNGAGVDWQSITNPAERMTRYRESQLTQQR